MSFESESGPLQYYPDESPQHSEKPPTAFGLFADEIRQKVREEHPDLSQEELDLELKERWEELDNDEKEEYKKKLKSMRSAERPLTAYIFWCKQYRREFTSLDKSLTGSEVTKLLGEMWSSLTEEEKEPYRAMEEESKAAYKKKWGAVEKVKRGKRVRKEMRQSTTVKKIKTSAKLSRNVEHVKLIGSWNLQGTEEGAKVQPQNCEKRTRTLTMDSNWSSFSDDVFSSDLVVNSNNSWTEIYDVDSMDM
ncbi:hypothetical protein B9Z55_007393 [Caenorhabditis nigoni]|uniref:HMG box domain-containing protein n=1 Tax=Caenorhabditis nigoni TaxID=1611254 RepID=A0A2G5V9M3_9PELO|nr:hypothetical protein B9Z55_007393 [Caenorhabditis nigoni]